MLTPDDFYEVFGFYERERFVKLITRTMEHLCIHYRQRTFTSARTNNTFVRITAVAKNQHVLGYAGKCETCGKVYYWHE